ncbi:NUDIX domain-containing protein [Skermania sp. ID1734]|uniref:NUDIX hydrolase n=1 Tax=Skermania sp. ID1734 TaxID=2597516 RepID=UPI00117C94E5|nr:NUDIX domain-containing protein [Skermania sp. ID1734]TSD99387.1 NUDIX domain-containing protein [Skermania sp. ID1734]
MRGDGDGWAFSPDGSRHWGIHGAAGLLLRAPLPDGRPAVLLQHRAVWSHQGGTWALPGGARDSHETVVHAAVREAEEEAGLAATDLRVRAEVVTARALSGWTYTTVVADASRRLATSRNRESAELRWVAEEDVESLPLHPGFAVAWPGLRAVQLRLVLDISADRRALATALPRTVTLPEKGFGWIPGIERAEEIRAIEGGLTALITETPLQQSALSANFVAITTAEVLS